MQKCGHAGLAALWSTGANDATTARGQIARWHRATVKGQVHRERSSRSFELPVDVHMVGGPAKFGQPALQTIISSRS